MPPLAAGVLQLQRTAGNAATSRRLVGQQAPVQRQTGTGSSASPDPGFRTYQDMLEQLSPLQRSMAQGMRQGGMSYPDLVQ